MSQLDTQTHHFLSTIRRANMTINGEVVVHKKRDCDPVGAGPTAGKSGLTTGGRVSHETVRRDMVCLSWSHGRLTNK